MIKVEHLTKKIGETLAVSEVNFDVNPGEIFGIVGPDGAGKSSLLRLMAGIVVPTEGSITVGKLDVATHIFTVKEQLAYMPQRFGLYEDLTVEENIFFFGRLFGISNKNIKKHLPRLYTFSRLEPFKKRLAGNLSGGMKQKLGLVCCLVHKPKLILLDEPTNGVDPVSRREFWRILYELLGEGVTIVVSTAYLDEAERCNRVAFMYNGSFMTVARPGDIKRNMHKQLLEITTDNVWVTEDEFKKSKKYRNSIREGNNIKIFVSNAGNAEKDIRRLLKKKKITVHSIKEKAPTLENCFMELVTGGDRV